MIKSNDFDNKMENAKVSPYTLNKKAYNNNNYYNKDQQNINYKYISPLRRSYDYIVKTDIFQNENLTINKVSPSHVLYRPINYDDGGYLNDYCFNKEKSIKENGPINDNINQRYLNTENNENTDNKYSNVYGFKRTDERRYKHYLRNPYYRGEDKDDGYKHYNPEENNFSGSSYGGYIYNYYLNAPMRSDKTENWRFPPLYYYRPKYK